MSWFSLSIQTKQSWDSHNKLAGILTGSYLGGLFVERGLKQCPAYLQARNAAVSAVANRWTPHSKAMNRVVSAKILDSLLNKNQVGRIGEILRKKVSLSCESLYSFSAVSFNVLKNASKDYFSGLKKKDASAPAPKTSSLQCTKELISYLYGSFSMKRSIELITMLKDRKLTEFSHSILTASLQPVCENAVQSGLSPIIKAGLSSAVDLGAKMTASVIFQSLLYKPIISALFKLMDVPNHEVHLSTLLLLSTAFHTSYLGLSILHKRFIIQEKDADKRELQQLALKLAKDPIQKALQSNRLFKYLELDAKTSDNFANKILEEVVDFYWTDLKEKKILGVPLVH